MSVDTSTDQLPMPPLAQGLPVLGNALAMQQDLMAFLVEQYRQLGPVFRIRALNREITVLAGPEANIFVTQEGADKFRSHEHWHEFGQEFDADHSLSAIDGESHLQLRKLFKPYYAVGRLLSDIPLLVDIAQKVINELQVGEEISALHLFRLIVTEQLGRAIASYAPGENLQSIITSIRVALNVHMSKQSPAFLLKMPSYQQAKRQYLKMGHDIVEEHKTTTRDKKDLVDDILEASQKPEFQETLGTQEKVAFASLGPFVAGLDTAANECTFMLYELLKHPDILVQCVENADQFFAEGLPTQEQIRSHGTLHNAMMETLRLHSIGPVLSRTAAKDFSFAGHSIKEGQEMMIATTASHFLPELFPAPYKFDIDRYSEERKEHKQRGAYAPFGLGTHLCLGAGAAEAQVVLVMAIVLHMVRLERVNPQAKLRTRMNPAPTLGNSFRVRISERRN